MCSPCSSAPFVVAAAAVVVDEPALGGARSRSDLGGAQGTGRVVYIWSNDRGGPLRNDRLQSVCQKQK
eukprot:7251170-Pyramimonas_sp.AAC.1